VLFVRKELTSEYRSLPKIIIVIHIIKQQNISFKRDIMKSNQTFSGSPLTCTSITSLLLNASATVLNALI
jgi:hypothetical protein